MILLKDIIKEITTQTPEWAAEIFLMFGVENVLQMDKEELKKHWLELNKKYHPDTGSGNTQSLKYINAAYDVLKNYTPSYSSKQPPSDYTSTDDSERNNKSSYSGQWSGGTKQNPYSSQQERPNTNQQNSYSGPIPPFPQNQPTRRGFLKTAMLGMAGLAAAGASVGYGVSKLRKNQEYKWGSNQEKQLVGIYQIKKENNKIHTLQLNYGGNAIIKIDEFTYDYRWYIKNNLLFVLSNFSKTGFILKINSDDSLTFTNKIYFNSNEQRFKFEKMDSDWKLFKTDASVRN
jgi:hypothetical protein